MTVEQAIEVFVGGFCFGRSLTHPYVPERIEGLWVMRDAPRRRGEYRKEEYVAHHLSPGIIDSIARRYTRGRYAVCHIRAMDEPGELVRDGFRALGYRLMATESFFVHSLRAIPVVDQPVPVVRVNTEEDARLLARATRSRPMPPEHLEAATPPVRQYMAVIAGTPVGWARSIVVGDAAYCSDVYVAEAYRRRGIATAMLVRLLNEDRESGAVASVLLASRAGAKLYPRVGYEQIGELLMFAPRREAASASQ